jgi:hypothetical protein
MEKKLTPADEELYKRVDEVLHYIWDPIGVSFAPAARDEYYSYLPHVFSLLKTNANAEHIAVYLSDVRAKQMGFRQSSGKDLQVAELLVDWKETIQQKYS